MIKKPKQTSFAAGRFSPELYGRTDLAKYASGFKDSKNFFVSPEGTLLNRAGTEYVGVCASGRRIIPFVFSDDDVVLLVLGVSGSAGTLEFFSYDADTDEVTRLNAVVNEAVYEERESTDRWGGQFDIYSESSSWIPGTVREQYPWITNVIIDGLQYIQQGDVIWFVRSDGSQGYKLERLSSNSLSWSFTSMEYEIAAFPTYGGVPALLKQYTATDNGILATNEDHGDQHLPTADDAHPARPWQWAVSRVVQDSTGKIYETLPVVVSYFVVHKAEKFNPAHSYGGARSKTDWVWVDDTTVADYRDNFYHALRQVQGWNTGAATKPTAGADTDDWEEIEGDEFDPINFYGKLPEDIVCYADRPVTITWRVWTQRPENIDDNQPVIIATRIYKGRDGRFGFIGEVTKDEFDFLDDGLEPDFMTPPRTSDHHFIIQGRGYSGASDYLAESVEYPSVLGLHEGRMLYGSSPTRPGLIVGSAVSDYKNIDRVIPANDAAAFALELASSKWEKIRFFVSSNGLYAFTSEGAWLCGGSGLSEVITPNSMAARQFSWKGAARFSPLVIGDDAVIFVDNLGSLPRAMFLKGLQSEGVDMAMVSRSFFRGKQIVSWAYAEVPWSTIWAALDDGSLLSCAWSPEQQLVAWAEHEIEDGDVISVTTLPVNGEHGVFLLVERSTGTYLERVSSRVLTDVRDARFLDAHVFYDGRNTDESYTAQIDNVGGNTDPGYDCTVTLTEDDAGSEVGNVVRVRGTDSDGEDIFCDVHLHTWNAAPTSNYTGELLTPLEDDLDGLSTDEWELCKYTMDGLEHLAGETVKALVDGRVFSDLTVGEGGEVVLGATGSVLDQPIRGGTYGAVICVGLAYNCDFESLDMADGEGRQRVIKSATIKTYGSRGGFVGQDFDHLEEIQSRDVSDEYGEIPLRAESTPVNVPGSYDDDGAVVYRQSDPLPVSITAIVREVEFGG